MPRPFPQPGPFAFLQALAAVPEGRNFSKGREGSRLRVESFQGRSFAARAVSRSSGSGFLRQRFNSTSRDFIPRVPIASAPQDLCHGSPLATSSATACSSAFDLGAHQRMCQLGSFCHRILLSSKGTSMLRNCDFLGRCRGKTGRCRARRRSWTADLRRRCANRGGDAGGLADERCAPVPVAWPPSAREREYRRRLS